MGRVVLPDTIRRRLEADGRLPPATEQDPLVARGAAADAKRARMREDWSGALAFQCRAAGLLLPVREWAFWPGRRFRFDLAWPDQWVAVEVDGGAFVGGRHTSGAGFRQDCVKLSEAAALGWRVLRVMPEHVTSGEALGWVQRALQVAP